MFLSKQPYPFLNLIEIHRPWFSNPDAEIAAMFVGGNTKNWTCHFSFFYFFLDPLCFCMLLTVTLQLASFAFLFFFVTEVPIL